MKAPLVAALAIGVGLIAVAAPGGRATTELPSSDAGGSAAGPGVLAWPLESFVLTQGFGCTDLALEPADPSCPSGHVHTGLDLAAPTGTEVHAAATGVVVLRRDDATGYGLHVVIDHDAGITTLYAHLSAAAVAEGDLVGGGDVIGRVGSSGNSTGPHLHFEVRTGGRPVDPELHLPARHPTTGGLQ